MNLISRFENFDFDFMELVIIAHEWGNRYIKLGRQDVEGCNVKRNASPFMKTCNVE